MAEEESVEVQEKECPLCEVKDLYAAIGAANATCPHIDDQDQRKECEEWALAIDPETANAKDVWKELIRKGGVDAYSQLTKLLNASAQDALIAVVDEDLSKGEPVSDEVMKVYRHFTLQRGI